MTLPTSSSNSDFFGKDGATPFIGIVEDVNDPKQAGRVKVRCIGWHPAEKTGEGGLSTEDLPWARVGAPTTHAQQNRIGGKHGLLVGSWVFGFLLDGEDANQPFVISSFPMTAKSTDKNLKQIGTGDATSDVSEVAYGRYVQNKNHPNIGVVTAKEQGQTNFGDENDQQGDGFTSDADSDCGGKKAMQSAASKRRQDEMKTGDKGNGEGQEYKVAKGDGLCGPLPHAKEDAKRKMMEQIPSMLSRFLYNDVVWNTFTGNYMNLNGILMSLAQDLCALFKFPANANKGDREKQINRLLKSRLLGIAPDRDAAEDGPRQQADKETTKKSDQFHAIFQETFIDILCQLIMQMLQGMNNSGDGGSNSDNDNDEGGANGETAISDWAADCLADQVINNIFGMTNEALDAANRVAEEYVDNNGNDGSSSDSLAGILGLLMQGMQFALTVEAAQRQEVHNTAGNRSQDKKTKNEGCIDTRLFSTLLGAIPAGSGGGSSDPDFANSSRGPRDWTETGFGGYPGEADGVFTDIPCEDATIPKEPDPGYIPDGDGNYVPGIPTLPPGSVPGVTPPPEYVPGGDNGTVVALPLPSDDEICAKNFVSGRPNTLIITNPGTKYFFNNREDGRFAFPNVNIPGYRGKPVPVVDRFSGEMVAVIAACSGWSPNPTPSVGIIPGKEEIGITTDDPNYDIIVTGFHIANTGFQYCDPIIELYDKDARTTDNATAQAIVRDGRIVDIIIINNGTGFRRIPDVRIFDNGKKCGTWGGHGAIIYPIMGVVAIDNSKPVTPAKEVIYCPAKNFKNLY